MHHEPREPEITVNRNGQYLIHWVCACGRRGKGSRTQHDAAAAYRRHIKSYARKHQY